MRHVDDVEEDGSLVDFLERGAERRDQEGRQIVDETDGVGEQHLPTTGHGAAARSGIEGGEELILGHHRRPGQRVEQRALAGVRVANQRDDRESARLVAGHDSAGGGYGRHSARA
jgi:hypothetical protein